MDQLIFMTHCQTPSENQMMHMSSLNCHHRCLYCNTVPSMFDLRVSRLLNTVKYFRVTNHVKELSFRTSFLCPSSGFGDEASPCILHPNLGILRAQFGCEDVVRLCLSSHKTPMPEIETVSKTLFVSSIFT